MKKGFLNCAVLILISFGIINGSVAQDTTMGKNKWHYLLQPYLMFPAMNGTVGIGALPNADVNANASDIFSHLQIGAMLYAEAYNKHWALTSDIIYMDLSQDVEGKRGIINGQAGATQFVWEVAGMRRLKPWLDLGVGLRMMNITSSLKINVDSTIAGGGFRSTNLAETWVDPFVVGRVNVPVGKKWLLQLRADVGGFGIGSKFAWQTQADIAYQFSNLFQLGLGYRIIGVDYEKQDGSDRFLYDMDTYGPVLRFGFHL